MWDVVCSFVHEGYLTRAHIHKELCNHTPTNEVSPPLIQSDPQPTFACLTRSGAHYGRDFGDRRDTLRQAATHRHGFIAPSE
jgi:hypothetical protein